jgi:lysophospholipase L1-like esterase
MLALLALWGCTSASDSAEPPEEVDTETDADVDTDVDADTDADTDTGTVADDAPQQSDGAALLPAGWSVTDPVLAVFMGDSITNGVGAPDGLDYVDLLYDNDDALHPEYAGVDLLDWYPTLDGAVDVSISGATTDTLVDAGIPALTGWMEAEYPDGLDGPALIVITIGGNDLQQGMLPFVAAQPIVDGALDRLEEALDVLQDPVWFPHGADILVTNVYEPSDGVGQSPCFLGLNYTDKLPFLDQYNARLHDLGERRGVGIVDLRGHFLGHGAHHDDPANPHYDAADPTRWFAPDCIHPNTRGHHELRRLMLGALDGQLAPL